MDRLIELRTLIASDDRRMQVLRIVRGLGLADCWVAAGFVRNCVWDHAHGRAPSPLPQDVDVIWFDASTCDAGRDAALEAALRDRDGTLAWSVKNQARMHARNGDSPYRSAVERVRSKQWEQLWPSLQIQPGSDPSFRKLPKTGVRPRFEEIF